jgi:bifunctional NMN adenylyltransferase/nudix hydrolase
MPSDREQMIRASLQDEGVDTSKFTFASLKDYTYSNNRWVLQVQKTVDVTTERLRTCTPIEWEPILVGVDKDDTTFYLKLFPQWKRDVTTVQFEGNATDIRRAMFEGNVESVRESMTPTAFEYLRNWMHSSTFARLQREYVARKKTKSRLYFVNEDGTLALDAEGKPRPCPYDAMAYCTDNVIIWRGHILLIRRRSEPGKGLWALPGGHLNTNEWIKDCAVRERQEETHIMFYSKRKLFLNAEWCGKQHQFDAPGRSENGRKITTAFLWVIPDEFEVEVQADDDADRAQWFSFYDVLEKMDYDLFEDHQQIIAHMILGPSL